MAELINTTGRSSEGEGRRHRLANGDSALFDVVTISETTTIGLKSAQYLAVTASGASRNLDFLAAVEQNGAAQVIYNAGSTYNVVLRDSAASTIATLLPGEWVAVVYDASAWAVLVKMQAAKFSSTEQTGTGSSQNIAHGLGSTPSLVWWSPSGLSGNACTFVPGAHDSTNIKMTVSSGEKYYVFAVK